MRRKRHASFGDFILRGCFTLDEPPQDLIVSLRNKTKQRIGAAEQNHVQPHTQRVLWLVPRMVHLRGV